MKITYITRTNVSSNAAQAKQITAMANGFEKILGNNFYLISPGFVSNKKINHKEIQTNQGVLSMNIRLLKEMFNIGNTVIFTRDIIIALFGVILSKKTVLEIHHPHKKIYTKTLLFFLIKFSSLKLVTISLALKNYYLEKYNISNIRILVAHDGVFAEQYVNIDKIQTRSDLGLPQNKFLVMHTGSLYKGGNDIYENLLSLNIKDVHFIHIGGSIDECKKLSMQYKKYDQISFLPQVSTSNIKKYQMSADLLLYINVRTSPIFWCTSPLKIFEYMATGIPILGSNIGSLGEVISDKNAYCYDPDDIPKLKEQFLNVINNYSEAENRAIVAKNDVIEKYDWLIRIQNIISFSKQF